MGNSTWSPTLVVAAVIMYKGKVLIQRCDASHPGFWEFPGGKVHYSEDLIAALKREVLEELGNYMWINVHRLLHCQVNDYDDGFTEYCVLFYHCTFRVPPAEMTFGSGAPIALVSPNELSEYNMLPGSEESIKSLYTVMNGDEPFSFVEHDVNGQTPEQTLLVGTYEWGRLVEYQHKARVYGPREVYYCEENQKKEMADHISMCRMYCEQRGWDFAELMKFGEDAYIDRMEDLAKYGVNSHKSS